MDRNARILSLGVALFGATILFYLAWNPRGMPRYGGWFFPNGDTVRTDSTRFDPEPLVGSARGGAAEAVPNESTRVQDHFRALSTAGWDVAHGEISSIGGNTAYDAVYALRPYWLGDELHAVVRVRGQLLGGIDALRDIAVGTVDGMRLEFSVTEPHWIIQIFMRD